jgi:hypothetical protein
VWNARTIWSAAVSASLTCAQPVCWRAVRNQCHTFIVEHRDWISPEAVLDVALNMLMRQGFDAKCSQISFRRMNHGMNGGL